MKDANVILGVSYNASLEEIKHAYTMRVRVVHPDRFEQDSSDWRVANEMLRELNEAYEWLRKFRTVEEHIDRVNLVKWEAWSRERRSCPEKNEGWLTQENPDGEVVSTGDYFAMLRERYWQNVKDRRRERASREHRQHAVLTVTLLTFLVFAGCVAILHLL
ncbi:MAG: DnaJ domain-containing protein [Synergistaceae bacterium]|jgi:curved DNA-binding protein CbpA|nr:DnaJ domain-containing protein [Synergistaceae bacterium]